MVMKKETIFLTIIVGAIVLFPYCSATSIFSSQTRITENDLPFVLLTGFEPFDVYEVNPSQLIVEALDGQVIEDTQIVGIVLPVDFDVSIENVTQAIETYDPILVISLGLFASTDVVNVETFGINLKKLPRNESSWVLPRRISPHGPFLHRSTIENREVIRDIRAANISVKQSFFAGMYVCNAVFYSVLGYIDRNELPTQSGFIHVPQIISQDPNGMELDIMIEAVTITILTNIK
jgi:pyroglutamyl-peptidase